MKKSYPPHVKFILILLITLFFLQGFLSIRFKSPTFDEPVHLSAGYLYWKAHRFDYNIIHPPLANLLNALPLLFHKKLKLPVLNKKEQSEWIPAEEFLYHNNMNADKMLNQSRLVTLLLASLLGWLIFRWSSELFSWKGGIISLLLFAFSPNLLAHSRLVTTDLAVTFFIFLSTYFFWKFINSPSLRSSFYSGLSLGLALTTKYSSLFLLPLYLFFVIRKKRKTSVYFLLILAISFLTVALTYGFIWFPYYFQGIKALFQKSQQGSFSFFHGNYRAGGWWFYFPFLFLVKTPLNLLFLLPITLFFLIKKKKKVLLPFITPVSYFVVALFSRVQIGARHLLPIYPFLFLLCGVLGNIQVSRKLKNFILALLFLYPLNSLLIFPHYLAYFNGLLLPSRAYRWVADSNIDWGQDLKGLKKWMDKNDISKVYLGYFGTANPKWYGINYRHLPSNTGDINRYYPSLIPQRREIIAISVSTYQNIYCTDTSFYNWLHHYKPIGNIGYSILLFDITGDPYAHLNLGINYFRSMLFLEAKEEFEKVLEIEPKNPIAWFNLGRTYEMMGNPGKTKICLEKALKFSSPSERKRIKKLLQKGIK
ncbi:MAG: phospholipid carrier-dependent glycosyltransferase [Caldiserica bacterium]|nr:phospholipid carrier-dependent glycosyltransferase [Caldisericota bacterium]